MRYYRLRQRFDRTRLADVAGRLAGQLAAYAGTVRRGERIALAVGSRAIANLPVLVRGLADWVRQQGGEPFIVPAMGSHGGATAQGQRALLERLGVAGAAPIVSSMEVVELGPGLFMDRQAAAADGVMVVNRVKPHTSFHGRYESGLMKMIVVGLGKQVGAEAIHRLGVAGLRETMPAMAQTVLASGRIRLGVAVVENAYGQTLSLEAMEPRQIVEREPVLLERARAHLPRLPVAALDLLIVDQLGKQISGTGMDTNVIGRLRIAGEPEPVTPRIDRIFVRDLVGDSAYGIGLADVTTRRLVEQTDWEVTRTNAQTSGFALRVVLPAVVERDEEAVSGQRIVRIRNTLQLEELIVSEPVRDELADRDNIEVLGPAGLWDAW